MRRFHFSLEPILNLKRQTRNQVEQELAARRRVRDAKHAELVELRTRLADESREAGKNIGNTTQLVRPDDTVRFLQHLSNTVDLVQDQVAELTQQCQTVLSQYRLLAQEIESMETLQAQQRSEYRSKFKKDMQQKTTEMISLQSSQNSKEFEQDD